MKFKLHVNGVQHQVDAPEDIPLLWLVRDYLHLTGTKFGCGIAQCGACTVHMDGKAIRSCVTPAVAAVGKQIQTIEGADSAQALALQTAWRELDVPQCGYCQSGQIMSAADLLTQNPQPNDDDIDQFMSGNICRCSSYERIRAGIKQAAKTLKEKGDNHA